MRSRLLVCIALCGVVVCVVAGVKLGAFGCAAVSCVTICLLCIVSLTAGTSRDVADGSDIKTPQKNVDLEPVVPPREKQAPIEPAMTEASNTDVGARTDADMATLHEATQTALLPPEDVEAVYDTSATPHEDAPVEAEETETVADAADEEAQPSESSHTDTDDISDTSASEDAHEIPSFDYDAFKQSILFSNDAAATLVELVTRTRKHMMKEEPVSAAEQFLWQQLEGDELYTDRDKSEKDSQNHELLKFEVVLPRHTNLYYLRSQTQTLPYGSLLRLLRVEATLNALHFAQDYYQDLNSIEMEDIYRLWQRTASSICGQATDVDTADWSYLAMPWQVPYGPSELGEWAVRQAISEAIESVQVPYRLEARFRCNVSSGDVAIEFNATPSSVFPRHAFVHGLGIIPTTSEMRSRESSKYAARIGLLLTNHAFRSSPKIRRVWIAAITQTPSSRKCLYSACIGRRAFSGVHMSSVSDPLQVLRSVGASLNEARGTLLPTDPTFYLEDELFCPPKRHDLWTLSERQLPVAAAHSLGANRVSGLVIHEELPRMLAADDMLRHLAAPDSPSATEESVRSILSVARKTSDMSVWSAAERVTTKLVDGALSLDDADALRKELVEGDELHKCVQKAQKLFIAQKPHRALDVLSPVIETLDASGQYEDTHAIVYRCFSSFSERVIYNRVNAHDKRSVVLVPDAYLVAHLLMSAAFASLPAEMGGSPQKALSHAHKALRVAPLNVSANLGTVACMEALNDFEGALTLLKEYLEHAHRPQSVGLAYYRLGTIERELGNTEVCKACYLRSANLFPPLIPFISNELQNMLQDASGFDSQDFEQEIFDKILTDEGIPLAPTARTSFILYDGATASVDAEVFPVAHDLMRILEAYSGDDVLRGIRNSLEYEPDA